MAPRKTKDHNQRVQDKENLLMQTFSPVEHYIIPFQSVLVWENPNHSIALFLLVHLLFWLATTLRVYYVIGVIGVIIVIIDMWKNHIWPEIRVPPAPGDDMEGWTPVHPRLLSVPEICQLLAPWWVRVEDVIASAVQLRRDNHPKFFFMAISLLCCSGFVGLYIRGITLAYLFVLFLLLFPCFLYNNGWERAQQIFQPLVSNLEATMRIRRTRSKRVRRGKRKHGEEPQPILDSDSDSEDLQNFVPETPTVAMEASPLARATAESDDEDDEMEGEGGLGLLTPPSIPSHTPSRDVSDTEGGSNSIDDIGSLTPHLSNMPAYDDTLDGTLEAMTSLPPDSEHYIHDDDDDDLSHDESLNLIQALQKSTQNNEHSGSSTPSQATGTSEPADDEIKFVTSHFSQFESENEIQQSKKADADDEEDEHQLPENVDFPEISTEETTPDDAPGALATAQKAITEVLAQPREALVQRGQDLVARLSAPAVSGTVTSLMAHTVAGFASLKDSVIGQKEQTPGDMEEEGDVKELEAEFEFLDEEDLAQVEEEQGLN